MKKILIAYDGTPGAEAAMNDTARSGLPKECEARVISIADVWLPPDPEAGEAAFPEGAEESRLRARQHALEALAVARQTAERGAEHLKGMFPQWKISTNARADSPAWGILGEARSWNSNLIVIGSHGRSPFHKFFLGSVSNKVTAEAHCSVRIYREHKKGPEHPLRILIGLDGSEDAAGAFREVLSREWPTGTQFQLVTVVDARVQSTAVMEAGIILPEPPPEGAGEWVQTMLTQFAEELRRRQGEVSTHVLEGDPKTALLRQADEWKADCIFVGARGLQHGSRQYLGTFASAVATRAHCTVEVIRPENSGAVKNGAA